MSQNPRYKFQQNIDYLGDFPGAQREKNRLAVFNLGGEVDVTSRKDRLLGRVTIENPAGDEVEPAKESTVQELATESTLASRLAREIVVDDGTGTFDAVHRSGNALLVQHDGVIDVASRDGRNLGEVAVNDLPDHDEAEADGSALAASGSVSLSVSAAGADRLLGTISSTGTYDLAVSWQTSTGTEIKSETMATAVSAGTATDIDLPARTPYAVVTITDTSAASQTVNGVAHLA